MGMSDFTLLPLLPELFLAITAMGFLIVGVMQGNRCTSVLSWTACLSFAIAIILVLQMDWGQTFALNNMFVMDEFAGFLKLLILLGLIVTLALSVDYLYLERMARFEFPVLVMFAGVGMMLMVSANNLLSLYMALELQSLSLYVLAAFQRNSLRSSEAAIKYFILGSLSSGLLLFGISLIYGFTGSIDFTIISQSIMQDGAISPGVTVGLAFLLAGLAFKISAVPFHMWTPDVYQGAPTAVTAFFAIVPKVAAFGLLIRILFIAFGDAAADWVQIVYFLSIASMVVGSFAAIAQEDIKRLMAYSSIGNMGYALMGVVAGTSEGVGSVILYMMIYMVMTAGVFTILLCMRRDGILAHKVSDLAGLSKNSPLMAYSMAALMFSMSGIPPLAGFFGKMFVFLAVVDQGYYILAVLGVLSSVVAAYYYLRVIKVMFFEEAADPFDKGIVFEKRAILFITILFVLGFIVKPNIFYDSAMSAANALFL